jgi:tripartite-type tricarboxylate transporter receptor subunit TctC
MPVHGLLPRLIRAAMVAAAIAPVATTWAADAFPDKPVHFIVPWNAGGSNDITARAMAQLMSEQGLNVIVENVPGATGAIGLQRVASAAPDGYTLGMGTSSTLAFMAQKLTPLTNAQFTPIARVTIDPLWLLVPADSPTPTLEAFVANAKKNDGKVTIGTPGTNNLNHIFAVMSGRVVGAKTVDVPYTGGSKVVSDLAGKQIDAGVLKPSESLAQVQGGLIKPIGVFGNERLKVMPDVPTFKEKGYDVFPYGPLVQMAYVVGPANLPPAVKDKLIAAFRTAIQSAKFKAVAVQGGSLVDDLTGAALNREVDAVYSSLAEVGKQVFTSDKKQ